jgi:N-acetyl-anhydromuramyl-L-alanine amidase AmpD
MNRATQWTSNQVGKSNMAAKPEQMMTDMLTPVEFQKKLQSHGYPLPQYGADGYWGDETSEACQRWFRDNTDLNAPLPDVPAAGVVPADWMPDCAMERIIVHWTAGSYTVSTTDREHYHIIVGGDAQLVRGDNSIKANVSTNDADGYAAHTKSCNSGSIGISAACMAGAIESPFKPGSYPLLEAQWLMLASVAADLCNKYRIAVTPQTVLQHGEVQETLGIPQSGKWDINKLPWLPNLSSSEAGDAFRAEVKKRL